MGFRYWLGLIRYKEAIGIIRMTKKTFGNTSILTNNRAAFNINENAHPLLTEIDDSFKTIFIIWMGNHQVYNLKEVTKFEYHG